MSGRGETPEADDDAEDDTYDLDDIPVQFGTTVYDEDGEPLGEVRGIEGGGFFVSVREGMEALNIEHARSGHEFGEAELMWRCTECGEMGKIEDGLPEECPNCDAPKEALMYWKED